MDQFERHAIVRKQVEDLCENFEDYLAEFNRDPLYDETLCKHKNLLKMRIKLGGAAKSIDSDEYLRDLRDMLVAWGMDSRGARLRERSLFPGHVRAYRPRIKSLESVGLAQIDGVFNNLAHITQDSLWKTIQGMKLSQTGSQLVTGAKALHHLLPQLMPPIDVTYTGKFFHYHNYSDPLQAEEAFKLMLSYFAQIARRVDVGQYVGLSDWATSESKLIDNAIIGYCNRHPDMPRGIRDARNWGRQRFG